MYLNGYLEDIGDTIDMSMCGNTSIFEYLNGRIGKQWKSPRNSLQISNYTLTEGYLVRNLIFDCCFVDVWYKGLIIDFVYDGNG